ncbi:MAG: FKBP-type peptidyl-prolyl cis-trans isomerase [Desulfobulbaceae bacterium]|nr:MAG: FKBP-type peptidyl-prolyl cis-trans isomerase [Desulfobulbaceae bacterium]
MNKMLKILLMAVMVGMFSGCDEATTQESAEQKAPEAAVEKTEEAPAPAAEEAATPAADEELGSELKKLSYSMGLDLGKYLSQVGSEVDLEAIKLGLEDGFTGAEPKMSEEEIKEVQEAFAERMKIKQAQELAAMMEKNLAEGQAFLAENAKKEGVMVTESGLQYEVLEQGDGEKPAAEDIVKVDYVGTLIDGSEFDSSIKRGEPITFPVNQVIPGWSEALQLMAVGSKFKVAIPSELAYGETGAQPVIPPNSVLVFEIHLLGIEPPVEVEDITEPTEGAEAPAEATEAPAEEATEEAAPEQPKE